ncbi:MAG: signal recognition particle-docking protein FtsY [Candidatus Aenigmatarchaeota archaeon]
MFGLLKKKIKESIEKISSSLKEKISEKEEVEPENVFEVKEEKILEQITEEKEIINEKQEIKLERVVEEKVEEPEKPIIEKEIKKLEEKIEKKPSEKKEGILDKIKKVVTEKEIKEEDIKDVLWEMQISLIENDVAVEVAEKICNDLKNVLVGRKIKRSENIEEIIKNSLKKSIIELLSFNNIDFDEIIKTKKPFLIIFLGFNGTGKTTSIARIAYRLKSQGKTVIFAAGDTWRAAAIEQLSEHAKILNIPIIKQKYMADPAAVIFDARKYAEAHNIDVILADTAGRSHANLNLMDELKKIVRVNKPDMKILVLDALTGNDIYDQCKFFNDAVEIDGLIITKADVYEKGGALISAAYTLKKPILFIGTGQNYQDLKKINIDEIIKNIFGE